MNSIVSPRTVIEAFLPPSGAVSLAPIYDAANEAGVEDQPVRLTIRRMIAAGEAVQHGRGRAGTLTLTPTGAARLEQDRTGLRLAFAQDAGLAPWDGLWHLYSISAPESERTIRDALRRDFAAVGAAPVSTGLWASPHDFSDLLHPQVAPYLVRATATALDMRGETDPRSIVETLWPAAPIVAAYADVRAALADTTGTPLRRQLVLTQALASALREDPLIPVELRDGWEPQALRRDWLTRWRELDDVSPTGAFTDGT